MNATLMSTSQIVARVVETHNEIKWEKTFARQIKLGAELAQLNDALRARQ